MSKKTKVLILCTANSARSQMGEGLLRHLAGDAIEVYSAGAKPSHVNPFAIKAMGERGIDISGHSSDSIDRYLSKAFDYIITVCDNAAENCPVFPGPAQRIHWSFADPATAAADDADALRRFIETRDGLEEKLSAWLSSLR